MPSDRNLTPVTKTLWHGQHYARGSGRQHCGQVCVRYRPEISKLESRTEPAQPRRAPQRPTACRPIATSRPSPKLSGTANTMPGVAADTTLGRCASVTDQRFPNSSLGWNRPAQPRTAPQRPTACRPIATSRPSQKPSGTANTMPGVAADMVLSGRGSSACYIVHVTRQ